MMYFTLEPPKQWQAGTSGEKPFYFGCGDCGAHDAVIAAILAGADFQERGFPSIGLLGDMKKPMDGPGIRPAMFCEPCWKEREAGRPPRAWNPPPPESWPHLKHHDPVRKCAGVRWRIFGNHIADGTPDCRRDWEQHKVVLRRRLERVLLRHLRRGGSLIECENTKWEVSQCRTAEFIAQHVANRVTGFGWKIALHP